MSASNGVGTGTILTLQALALLWTITVVTANKRYCGTELVKVLSFLCDEFPDLHTANKKAIDTFKDMGSDEWMNADDSTQQQMILDQQLQTMGMMGDEHEHERTAVPAWMNMVYPSNYMFRHGAAHNELIPARFRKSRGGIVEECCLRPCGMNQLLQYCKKASTQ